MSLVRGSRNIANNPVWVGFSHIFSFTYPRASPQSKMAFGGNERAGLDGSLLPDLSSASKKQQSESMIRQKEHFPNNKLCTLGIYPPEALFSDLHNVAMKQPCLAHKVIAALTRGGVLKRSLELQAC